MHSVTSAGCSTSLDGTAHGGDRRSRCRSDRLHRPGGRRRCGRARSRCMSSRGASRRSTPSTLRPQSCALPATRSSSASAAVRRSTSPSRPPWSAPATARCRAVPAVRRHRCPGRRPIVAIPTTSGTGAEVTRTCIVADRAGRKSWTWGDEMLPDLVVLDPTAAATMPHAVTVGHRARRVRPRDRGVQRAAAQLGRRGSRASGRSRSSSTHLPRVAADGSDLASRQAMQEAAFLAGIAIDNCGTGVAHSIGHALGSLYHVPHGISVAVGLRRRAGVERRPASRSVRRRGRRAGLRRRRGRRPCSPRCASTPGSATRSARVDVACRSTRSPPR